MAVPAEPILASVLWESHRSIAKSTETAPRAQPLPKTEIYAIDDALDGCIRYGGITCIHSEDGSGGPELCEAILSSHLLTHQSSVATVIDVGSTFDVRHIHQSMLSRIQDTSDTHQKVLKVLDRLNIMKVFDCEGLADAVAEVRHSAQHRDHSSAPPEGSHKQPRGTVGDSESEEELFDTPSPEKVSADTVPDTTTSNSLLLINNIHQIMSPLIKSNHVKGQALLISFMRSLALLTKGQNFCTIITSGTTSFNKWKEESSSAFASCTLRPVLGKAFSHLLDSEMMVHQTVVRGTKLATGGKEVSVVEVLQNRHGKGVGRWAPFIVGEDGMLSAYT